MLNYFLLFFRNNQEIRARSDVFKMDFAAGSGHNIPMRSFLIGLCAAVFALSTAAAATPQAATVAEEPALFRDSERGQVLVRCSMDGVPLLLLLDTGATHTVLDTAVAAEKLPQAFQLDTSGMTISGNAEGVTPSVLLVKLGVAGRTRSQFPVLVLPLNGVRGMLQHPVDGILGMDVLSHLPFTLDFRPNGHSHWGADTDGEAHPLPAHPDQGGCPLTELRCGDKVLRDVLLDSGSTSTLIAPEDWPAGEGETRTAQVADVNGQRTVSVRFGNTAAAELAPGLHRPLRPQLQEGINRSSASAILGIDALRGLRLVYHPEQGFFLLSDKP